MAQKPSIPKGTRDFSPVEMLRRKYIFRTIEQVFQKYGFLPLETPAMENLETLTGKYGEEGDRLIFKILNSGDWKAGLNDDDVSEEIREQVESIVFDDLKGSKEKVVEFSEELIQTVRSATNKYYRTRDIAEKALRYDLTVPFARYVVQHQNEIAFPFKRYQIQPVWRADRPQKGRYREFYQCDADVIGSKSLLNEIDLVQIFDKVFTQLNLTCVVKLNSRKVLAGISEVMGQPEKLIDFTIVLDKLEKVGREKVVEEALERGITEVSIAKLDALFAFIENPIQDSNWKTKVGFMRSYLKDSPIGQEGLNEVEFILQNTQDDLSIMTMLDFDWTLARGLDYYTGAIFEVVAKEGSLRSSICGGGRYDDLTGIFGLKNMSGVGISFGADRIYDVLLETGKFPAELGGSTKLLFANFGEAEAMHCLKLLCTVREAGIAAELYPDPVKMAKQFKYADDKGIAYVAIIGETELKEGIVTVKDMRTGEQKAVKQEELLSILS